MAIEIGERQIGAAGMIDADEGGMGDEVEALLAAIFRMGPPADVTEQAGCNAEARFFSRLVEAEGLEHHSRPWAQLLHVPGRARAQIGELLAGRNQRILRLLLAVEEVVEMTLAHAE